MCVILLFLGGDSKTMMIVHISPVVKNVSESMASLLFAERVRSIELGQATVQVRNCEHCFLCKYAFSYIQCSLWVSYKQKLSNYNK